MVASTMSATIMPTPISLMNVMPEAENAPMTTASSSAALDDAAPMFELTLSELAELLGLEYPARG
jgi:hypothetical protein